MNPFTVPALPLDPLKYDVELEHRATFYPLGLPVTIATNCEAVVAAGEEVWGRETPLQAEWLIHPPVELRFAVSAGAEIERPPPSLPRGQQHLVSIVHDAANFAVCDLRAGFGFGWFTAKVACDRPYVRYHFLEPLVYLALEALYLTPIHAACVARANKAILLCGESHAGKTTLAYACARKGWQYVSDDASHLVRNSSERTILGKPHFIRLRADAPALFPELARYAPRERPNGKLTLELDTSALGIGIAREVRAECLVFLNRSISGGQQMSPRGTEETYVQLAKVICFGEEKVREQQRESLRRLAALPAYDLRYNDVHWAEQMLEAVGSG